MAGKFYVTASAVLIFMTVSGSGCASNRQSETENASLAPSRLPPVSVGEESARLSGLSPDAIAAANSGWVYAPPATVDNSAALSSEDNRSSSGTKRSSCSKSGGGCRQCGS